MRIATTANELARLTQSASASRQPSVFVPTMGALHEGHVSLIDLAVRKREAFGNGPVVVSIFVNPTQFNDPADLARYPRTLDADAELCRGAGADIVYAPAVEDVYPPGVTIETPPLPDVATQPGLEDAHRPGHFAGVAQVVLRLFRLVNPRAAVFGEKDWQQLQVVDAMVRQLALPINILSGVTLREHDGLAMSSRNRFLSPADRQLALTLFAALKAAQGETTVDAAEARLGLVLREGGIDVQYAVVRDARTLLPTREPVACRALIAAKVGTVRLIDNAAWRAGAAPR